MKIKQITRLLLIAVAAIMVFSLFACSDGAPEGGETTTEEIVNNEETSGTPDGSTVETGDKVETNDNGEGGEATEGETTEPVEGETTDPAEGETTEPTEDETTEPQVPACAHTECTEVAAKDATCTEAGNPAYKACAECGKFVLTDGTLLDEAPVIEALGHTETPIAGKPATCTEAGITEGKKCTVCGVTTVEQTTINALGHTQTDKAWTAPTDKEEGWEAHKACANCDMVWDTEGNEIDEVPTIAKIVPTVNKYYGFEYFKGVNVEGGSAEVPANWKPQAPSADRTFVRYERAGMSTDGNINFLSANKDVTGQYMIIKYKTDHMVSFQIWANTEENGHSVGKACKEVSGFVADGQWHIIIFDLAEILPDYVKVAEDGTYTIQWARIDILDGTLDAGYMDIGFIALCDDLTKALSVMLDGDIDLCPHVASDDPEYNDLGDNHATKCIICDKDIVSNHSVSAAPKWNSETKKYSVECICGATFESTTLYVSEASTTTGACNSFAPAKHDDGFVRYTCNGTDDPFAHIYMNGTSVTGQYAVIKYRVSKSGVAYDSSFVGSVTGEHHNATNNCDSNKSGTASGSLIYTEGGEWQYVIVEAKSTCFKPNADGSYSYRFLRLDLAGFVAGDYIDIDEIAFVDNMYAAALYVNGEDAVCSHAGVKPVWNSEEKVYKANCADCGAVVSQDSIYKTEGTTKVEHVLSSGNFLEASQQEGFVRYTPVKSADDPYFYPLHDNTVHVTGKYMIIKYRAVNNGKNMSTGAPYASTVPSGLSGAAAGNNSNETTFLNGTTLYADGEWHYLIVAPLAANDTFVANDDGTYTWRYLRMRLNGFDAFDGSCYFDIDEIIFFDNIEAVETIGFGAGVKNIPFTVNLDKSNCALNGTKGALYEGGSTMDKALVIDATGMQLDALNSIAVGGWCVTPGGIASYKYRIVSADGVAIENPTLEDYFTGGSSQGITNQGISRGWSSNCGNGGAWQAPKAIAIDVQYEGKTVNIEVVAITNYGNEIVIVKINNVSVPKAYNGPATSEFYIDETSIAGKTEAKWGKLAFTNPRFKGDLTDVAVYVDSTMKVDDGWNTLNGGWDRYVYRVTDGENVYEVVPTGDVSTRADIAADGMTNGFDEDCGINCHYSNLGFSFADVKDGEGQAVNLAGKTVTVELVGITNNGEEVLIARFTNVTVQAR